MIFDKSTIKRIFKIGLVLMVIGYLSASCRNLKMKEKSVPDFDGQRAYQDVLFQMTLGPRIPETDGHLRVQQWIESVLLENRWEVEHQEHEIKGKTIINLIAYRGTSSRYILLGAHYDTRMYADLDPDPALRMLPVPGANDGASGVALLLEMSRSLPDDLPVPVQLVFFDAEDNGGLEDWEWIMGSRAFVQQLEKPPESAIIVDMIGDSELNIYQEQISDAVITEQIWNQAKLLGYGNVFLPESKHSIIDDHIPFIEAGIPAVDIIDIEYPYWHTTEDTADKVSSQSLQIVGDTLLSWLLSLE